MPSPSASRDDGTPINPEKSLAKEIGVKSTVMITYQYQLLVFIQTLKML